jgi:hypothetical protein
MCGEPNLAGQSILILESDYLQARKMEHTLSSAGLELSALSQEKATRLKQFALVG